MKYTFFRPNMNHRTLIVQRPTKQLDPTHAYLFDLLHPGIIAAIDTWLAVLKYGDKFKHVILRFKFMIKPVSSSINA